MNSISGIDNLRKELERQRGNMQGHIAIPICEKYEQRTADRQKDGAKKAELANGGRRGGIIAITNVEHKPNGDTKL